jgi:hypothetical protein
MGISIGSESSGGIQDVFVHDNVVGLCEQGERYCSVPVLVYDIYHGKCSFGNVHTLF